MSDTTKPKKGIRGLACPDCGSADSLRVYPHDGEADCGECNATFTAEDLRVCAARLIALADWMDTIPTMGDDD